LKPAEIADCAVVFAIDRISDDLVVRDQLIEQRGHVDIIDGKEPDLETDRLPLECPAIIGLIPETYGKQAGEC
jgi:hypothetical protein